MILAFWAGALAICSAAVYMRHHSMAVATFALALTINPLIRLGYTAAFSHHGLYLDELRYIMAHTTPADTVMDGYEGAGVFRPHAWFYWFLAYNERQRITEAEKRALFDRLVDGSIAPKLILFYPEPPRSIAGSHGLLRTSLLAGWCGFHLGA